MPQLLTKPDLEFFVHSILVNESLAYVYTANETGANLHIYCAPISVLFDTAHISTYIAHAAVLSHNTK